MWRVAAALASATLPSLAIAACGGSTGTSGHSASSAVDSAASRVPVHGSITGTVTDKVNPGYRPNPPEPDSTADYTLLDGDQDNDVTAPQDDTNNNAALDIGQAASPAELRAIVPMVKRYYSLALAGDGARGCTLLYSTLVEAAAEDYAVPGGPPYVRGDKNCTEVLTGVFRHYHRRLAALVPLLQVSSVRLQGGRGYAFLRFGRYAERELIVDREGAIWRIGAFIDGELP